MKFSDVFFKPFRGDPGGYSVYIWCGKNTMCFNILRGSLKDRIIDLLNEDTSAIPFSDIGISDDFQYITNGYSPLLKVRGWGLLTGGLGLSPSEAIQIQKDFVQWAAEKLKGL